MTVIAVLASLAPMLWEKRNWFQRHEANRHSQLWAACTSTIHVLILVPVLLALLKGRALRRSTLRPTESNQEAMHRGATVWEFFYDEKVRSMESEIKENLSESPRKLRKGRKGGREGRAGD
jgi:hypothetical protein